MLVALTKIGESNCWLICTGVQLVQMHGISIWFLRLKGYSGTPANALKKFIVDHLWREVVLATADDA